jgi:hypothetical protein
MIIPPLIKRSRILVSGGVVIVISVKLYEIKSVAITFVDAKRVAGLGRILPENSRFPISSDQQNVAASNHHFLLCAAGFSLPASHFCLFPQIVCTLLETTNRFDSYPSL